MLWMSLDQMIKKLMRDKETHYPLTTRMLKEGQFLKEIYLACVQSIIRYGEYSWKHYERILMDLLRLAGVAPQYLTQFLNEIADKIHTLPHHKKIEIFEEVQNQIYNKAEYPLLEHYFYLLPHGVTRLKVFLEFLELISLERATFCDLGFGPGVQITAILTQKTIWYGHGVDISPACLEYTQKMLKLYNCEHRCRLHLGDARNIEFKDASFHVVIACEIIEHVPNPETIIKEIVRILKPKGYAIISTPVKLHWGPHLYVFQTEKEVQRLYEENGLKMQQFKIDNLGANQSKVTYALLRLQSSKGDTSQPF